MSSTLRRFVEQNAALPLAWAGGTANSGYLNFGDALSPIMVALCSGLPVERIPSKAATPRMAAVGTIGHAMEGGSVWFWGSGASNRRNPHRGDAALYSPPADTEMHLHATRGPVSREILSGEAAPANAVYGDPVWALPRFYENRVEKRYELGVVLHLSELADREFVATPKPEFRRYDIPEELRGTVTLINTVTDVSVDALHERLDAILACKRIVSTSLHGLVVPESYGIPCLYFSPQAGGPGLVEFDLASAGQLDLRVLDLYRGVGLRTLTAYAQSRDRATDWHGVIAAVDAAWSPKAFDPEPLLHSFPLGFAPVSPPAGGTVFDLPLLRSLTLSHSVSELRRIDSRRAVR